MYYVGKGVKQDFKQAYAWYLKAAEQDHIEAQYRIGNMHLIGEGTEQDYYLAEKWYGKAAAQGHIVAGHNISNIRKAAPKSELHMERDASTIPALTDTRENIEQTPDTESVEPDEISTGTDPGQLAGIENLDEVMEPEDEFVATAPEELPQSSDANQPDNKVQSTFEDADLNAGRIAFDRGDYAQALGNFEPLAEDGSEDAQVYLGLMYYVGKGVEQDFKQAYAWYLKAAEQDHIEAQYRIGNMH